jgi:nitrogen regulatory protein P-II 1
MWARGLGRANYPARQHPSRARTSDSDRFMARMLYFVDAAKKKNSRKPRSLANLSANYRERSMTKIEAVIQPSKLEAVKEALTEMGIDGMTVFEVRGHGRQKGHTETYRGREYSVDLLPKVKLEMVVDDKIVEPAIDAIVKSAATGKIGDGKIFLTKVDEAIRIRNLDRGVSAL